MLLVQDKGDDDGDMDLNTFRTHVNHATTKHLTTVLKKSFQPEYGNGFLKGVHLDSTLRHFHNNNATDPRSEMNVSFEGSLTVSDVGQLPDDSELHALLEQAFLREDYWILIRRFVEDPVLENIDFVEIFLSESSSRTQSSSSGTPTNTAAVAAVVVFSIVFALAVGALVYFAHRRFRAMHDMCCSQSKVSESTDDEDDGGEEFGDEGQDKAAATTRRKKKHRAKAVEHTNVDISSLDSIQEEGDDDDGMLNIPLDRELGPTIV
jgi:hypothetical protein